MHTNFPRGIHAQIFEFTENKKIIITDHHGPFHIRDFFEYVTARAKLAQQTRENCSDPISGINL